MSTLTEEFQSFIRSDRFPCVGAKAARARKTITVVESDDIERSSDDCQVHEALCRFGDELDTDAPFLQSCAVIYAGPTTLGETAFEDALWRRLQSFHEIDLREGNDWAQGVSSDPSSAAFSMSIGGKAFFVVGLHPHASRPARRFAYPTLVFNSHDQFEQLRADGRYEKMKKIIRSRDTELAGGINPMLNDFGRSSEARQYSGRKVGSDWRCPFHPQALESSQVRS